jgi:hypothetical protein
MQATYVVSASTNRVLRNFLNLNGIRLDVFIPLDDDPIRKLDGCTSNRWQDPLCSVAT